MKPLYVQAFLLKHEDTYPEEIIEELYYEGKKDGMEEMLQLHRSQNLMSLLFLLLYVSTWFSGGWSAWSWWLAMLAVWTVGSLSGWVLRVRVHILPIQDPQSKRWYLTTTSKFGE